MLQKNNDKLLSCMPNVFDIADDISISGFEEQGKDYDETLDKVLWVCR